jgi:hypothetical protein
MPQLGEKDGWPFLPREERFQNGFATTAQAFE